MGVDLGRTERDLIEIAGPPTRRLTDPDEYCRQKGGIRELVYEEKTIRFGGLLGESVLGALSVCIDKFSTIVDRSFIQI